MSQSPFTQMQRAVDIVSTSPHPANKIAATLFGRDKQGAEFSISRTNYWPAPLCAHVGTDTLIGNSSGTIHAETACILDAPFTDEAALCVTDPFCPNCAKNIAEAGIRTIYIDHKGFAKDFAKRRGDQFENMSMRICARAGIDVFSLNRKEESCDPILKTPDKFTPYEDNPVKLIPLPDASYDSFATFVHGAAALHKGRRFAAAAATDPGGKTYGIVCRPHPAIGYSMQYDTDEIENKGGKYSFIQEPINRILMNVPRHGLRIMPDMVFCTHVPTSREQVNMVGAGITRLFIADLRKARDDFALQAMTMLGAKNIIRYDTFQPLSEA